MNFLLPNKVMVMSPSRKGSLREWCNKKRFTGQFTLIWYNPRDIPLAISMDSTCSWSSSSIPAHKGFPLMSISKCINSYHFSNMEVFHIFISTGNFSIPLIQVNQNRIERWTNNNTLDISDLTNVTATNQKPCCKRKPKPKENRKKLPKLRSSLNNSDEAELVQLWI